MLKKAIFAAALTLGFVTSFHLGGKPAVPGQSAIRVELPSQAAADCNACGNNMDCYCHCYGWCS